MILNKLNIFGVTLPDEKMILASMMLGDPVLLIGPPGSAKTELAKQLLSSLLEESKADYELTKEDQEQYDKFGILPKEWTKFATYDCSKMQFEEIIGFPNPSSFKDGYVDYVESPITIWNKFGVILDEFNRQTKRQQNTLFELIRSRTIYGRHTGVKMIFACMNLYGMHGTEILDEALVDRMGSFIYTQGFEKLDDIVREDIIIKRGKSDSPAITCWNKALEEIDEPATVLNKELAAVGRSLKRIFKLASSIYEEQEDSVGEEYALFVNRFIAKFQEKCAEEGVSYEITSRRASMIYRALLAYRSIELAMGKLFGTEVDDIKDSLGNVITRTLPIGISESTGHVPHNIETIIYNTVSVLGSFFRPGDNNDVRTSLDVLYEVVTTTNMVHKLKLLINYLPSDVVLQNSIWDEITNSWKGSQKDVKTMQSACISLVLANMTKFDNKVLPDTIYSRVTENYEKILNNSTNFIKSIKISDTNYKFATELRQYTESIVGTPLVKLYASMLIAVHVHNLPSKARVTEEDARILIKNTQESVLELENLLKEINKLEVALV